MAVEIVNKEKALLLLVLCFARNIDAFPERYFSRYLTSLNLKKKNRESKKSYSPEEVK